MRPIMGDSYYFFGNTFHTIGFMFGLNATSESATCYFMATTALAKRSVNSSEPKGYVSTSSQITDKPALPTDTSNAFGKR